MCAAARLDVTNLHVLEKPHFCGLSAYSNSSLQAPYTSAISVLLVMLYHASFCFARGVEKKIANQKECSVAERDDGIPVIVVAAVKETIS